MPSDIVRAWRSNCRATMTLLDALPAAFLKDQYSPRTRTVAAQFAHIHYVRHRNLEFRGGPAFVGKVRPFEKGAQPKKRELQTALKASAKAMEKLIEHFEEQGKIKSWRGSLAQYLGYHAAHEAHHRGLAIVSVRLSGHKLPKEAIYGLWDLWRKAED